MVAPASKVLNGALRKFADARTGARRFHSEALGRGVNPYRCLGDWLLCVATGDVKGIRARYGKALDYEFADVLNDTGVRSKAVLSVSAGGLSGGYLVPQELREDLMADVSEEAFVRPYAHVQPMTSATLDLPWPDMETTTGTAGVPPFFGGFAMKFTEEATGSTTQIVESEPQFRSIELRANDLSGYLVLSNPLMQDGRGLEAHLRRLIARSVGWYEDYFFLRGTGVGQPLGVLNSGAAIKVTRNGANLVKYVDMSTMLTDLLPYSYLHAAWYLTVSAMVQVTQLIDASGKTAWVPNYPPSEDGKGTRSVGEVLGRPAYVTEKLPALGSLGDVTLADPSLYVIGDRQALEIDVSQEVKTQFLNNQAVWRVLERIDGRPLFDKSITLSDQATVVSPIVLLN